MEIISLGKIWLIQNLFFGFLAKCWDYVMSYVISLRSALNGNANVSASPVRCRDSDKDNYPQLLFLRSGLFVYQFNLFHFKMGNTEFPGVKYFRPVLLATSLVIDL